MDLCDIRVIRSVLGDFRFVKAKGQNFLVDSSIPKRMSSIIDSSMGVLEIGPGFGALTAALCEKASKVVAIETDKRLIPVLKSNMREFNNFVIIEANALKVNLDEIIAAHFQGLNAVSVSNLPYAYTSDMLVALIKAKKLSQFTVMVQKEVAMRLAAAPAASDYGAITVFTNVYGNIEILFDVHPHSFLPQPSVISTVLTFTRHIEPLVSEEQSKFFFQIVRGAFSQRRKTLLNSLYAVLSQRISKDALQDCLKLCKINPMARGETLSAGEFLILANQIRQCF